MNRWSKTCLLFETLGERFAIVRFDRDLEQHWIAELDCGHCQQIRLKLPFFLCPRAKSEARQLENIGQLLN